MSIVSASLVSHILEGYSLPIAGIHGAPHWARVMQNARALAKVTGADLDVVELFAVFHDSRRLNESIDRGHGRRGGDFAHELRGLEFDLDENRLALLEFACAEHTAGMTAADPTVQVCWDADRLDLLRVGTRPRPQLLCTDAARAQDILDWANRRASRREIPDLVHEEWSLRLTP
jgi:uncharacterized protein